MNILIVIFIGVPLALIFLHTLLRIISYFYKFPLPPILAKVIDHPLRHRIQPPDEMAVRHGIQPGMRVLEVGPGSGTYTMAAARRVGENGRVSAVDIEPRMIEYVREKAEREGIRNIDARVADVYNLPFDDGFFDAVFMITVIGEIPDPDRAIREFYRVLKPAGTLAFSELFLDPDYPMARTLIRKSTEAGFELKERIGHFFHYTLIFQKPDV